MEYCVNISLYKSIFFIKWSGNNILVLPYLVIKNQVRWTSAIFCWQLLTIMSLSKLRDIGLSSLRCPTRSKDNPGYNIGIMIFSTIMKSVLSLLTKSLHFQEFSVKSLISKEKHSKIFKLSLLQNTHLTKRKKGCALIT